MKIFVWSGRTGSVTINLPCCVFFTCVRVRGGCRSPVCWPGRLHNQRLHPCLFWCSSHVFLRCQTEPVRWGGGAPAGELWGVFTITIHTSLKSWMVIAYCIVLIAVTQRWEANQQLLDIWILSVIFRCGYGAGMECWDNLIYFFVFFTLELTNQFIP